MQNRYVGDIGDYVKLAILRALLPGRRLGVAWWLYPDERHNRDGLDSRSIRATFQLDGRKLFVTLYDAVPGGAGYVVHLGDAGYGIDRLVENAAVVLDCPDNCASSCRRCLVAKAIADDHQADVAGSEHLHEDLSVP